MRTHGVAELAIHPTRRSRRTMLIGIAAAILVFGGSAAVAQGPAAGLIVAGFVAAVCLPVAAWVLAHHHRAEIAVTSTDIVISGAAKQRRFARADAALLVHAMLIAPRTPVYGNLFVLDHHGNRLARIYTKYYRDDDLERLVGHLDLPVSAADRPVTANQLATWYPGIVPWVEAHPIKLGLVTMAATSGAVVIAIVALNFA